MCLVKPHRLAASCYRRAQRLQLESKLILIGARIPGPHPLASPSAQHRGASDFPPLGEKVGRTVHELSWEQKGEGHRALEELGSGPTGLLPGSAASGMSASLSETQLLYLHSREMERLCPFSGEKVL